MSWIGKNFIFKNKQKKICVFINPHVISNLRPQSAEAPNLWIEGPTFSKNQGDVYFYG